MNIKLNWEPILSKALMNKENQLNCNTEALLKTQTTEGCIAAAQPITSTLATRRRGRWWKV